MLPAVPQVIYLMPSPTVTGIEGNSVQFACGPLDPLLPPPILQINGVDVNTSDLRLSFQDFPGDNRTYTYDGIQRAEEGTTFQCFSADRSVFSNTSVLIVYCEFEAIQTTVFIK